MLFQVDMFQMTDGSIIPKLIIHNSGYVDDPRNTDHAWIETTAFNFHDESGAILNDIKFEAGDDARNVKWLQIDQHVNLYANHALFVSKVATRLNAHW